MEKTKITVEESPYGDAGVTYDGMLGIFQHFRLQLVSYRSQNKTPEQRQYLEDDIAGYEEVIKSGSEANAENFIRVKRNARMAGNRFKNNLEIVQFLKDTKQWKTPVPFNGE